MPQLRSYLIRSPSTSPKNNVVLTIISQVNCKEVYRLLTLNFHQWPPKFQLLLYSAQARGGGRGPETWTRLSPWCFKKLPAHTNTTISGHTVCRARWSRSLGEHGHRSIKLYRDMTSWIESSSATAPSSPVLERASFLLCSTCQQNIRLISRYSN